MQTSQITIDSLRPDETETAIGVLARAFATRRAGPLTTIFSIHLVIVLGWILLYLGYHYLRRSHMAEAERWRLQLVMRETELRALRAQLNPHFLFNSLNSLRGLITEDPARAQDAATGLAGLLRHTLQLSRAPTTTLERELEAARHYLELEALRFESRLRYEITIDPAALEHPVPPLLLQTIVENALKHGIAPLPGGGEVHVAVRMAADGLRITVRNTGRLEQGRTGAGIGLTNALERLRLIFGDSVSLELRQTGPNEVTCTVIVPPPRERSPGSSPHTHALAHVE